MEYTWETAYICSRLAGHLVFSCVEPDEDRLKFSSDLVL